MGGLFSHLPFTDGEIFGVLVVVSFIIPGLFRLTVFPSGLMWALTIKIRLFLGFINPLKARYTMCSHASPSGFKVLINSRVYLILSFKFWVKMILALCFCIIFICHLITPRIVKTGLYALALP